MEHSKSAIKESKSASTSHSVSSDSIQPKTVYGLQVKHGFENSDSCSFMDPNILNNCAQNKYSKESDQNRKSIIELPSPNMIIKDSSKARNERSEIEVTKDTLQEALNNDTGSSMKDELDITLRGYKVHLALNIKYQSSFDAIADKINNRRTVRKGSNYTTLGVSANTSDINTSSQERLPKYKVENSVAKVKQAICMINLEAKKDELDVTLRDYAMCHSCKYDCPCNIKDILDVTMKGYVVLPRKKGEEIKQANIGFKKDQFEIKMKKYAPNKRRTSLDISRSKNIVAPLA